MNQKQLNRMVSKDTGVLGIYAGSRLSGIVRKPFF